MRYSVQRIVGCIAVLMGVVSQAADASLIVTVDSEVSYSNGKYDYIYSLNNSTASTIPIVNFNLEVAANSSLTSLSEPLGWYEDYSPGDIVVSWQVSSFAFSLYPAQSYNFGFDSSLPPASNSFSILGLDPNTFMTGSVSGQTASPSSIPTPPSLLLFFLGLSLVHLANISIKAPKHLNYNPILAINININTVAST